MMKLVRAKMFRFATQRLATLETLAKRCTPTGSFYCWLPRTRKQWASRSYIGEGENSFFRRLAQHDKKRKTEFLNTVRTA